MSYVILNFHQIEHFLIGLLFCPNLQLNVLENSSKLDVDPSTLNWDGECESLINDCFKDWSLDFSHHNWPKLMKNIWVWLYFSKPGSNFSGPFLSCHLW